jgi:hypothetical protein
MALSEREILTKQLEMLVARKAMDDADCVLKADRNQKEIDKVQLQLDALPQA